MRIQTFGATFSPRDEAMIASRMPNVGRQSTFGRSDSRFIERELPPVVNSTRQRIDRGAMQAGFTDFAGSPGILPRAIHALNARREPSNAGAEVARRQGMNAVMNGFYGVAGLGGAGCTSTGANVAGGIMAAGGSFLTSFGGGANTGAQNVADATTPKPVAPTTGQRAMAITGALLAGGAAVWGGVCQAQSATGVAQPGITAGSQAGALVGTMVSDIRGANAAGSASATPAVPDAALPALVAPGAGEQPASSDKTMLYVGGGVAALVVLALVMRR